MNAALAVLLGETPHVEGNHILPIMLEERKASASQGLRMIQRDSRFHTGGSRSVAARDLVTFMG